MFFHHFSYPFFVFALLTVVSQERAAFGGSCSSYGGFVSKDTCRKEMQCGTKEAPYCSITAALKDQSEIFVAKSHSPYEERLSIPRNVSIHGGYRSDFSSERDQSATLLGRIEVVGNPVVSIRHLQVEVPAWEDPEKKIAEDAALRVWARARLTLDSIHIDFRESTKKLANATQVAGVWVNGGATVSLRACSIKGGKGEELSSAVAIYGQGTQLGLSGVRLNSGAAPRSIALGVWGGSAIEIADSHLQPGRGFTTAGVRAVEVENQTISLKVRRSKIFGGPDEDFASTNSNPQVPVHVGISSRDADVDVSQSTIWGSPRGEAERSVAIDLVGLRKTKLVATQNKEIMGGVSGSPYYGQKLSVGIATSGNVDALISQNERIQGCTVGCRLAKGYGVFLNAFASGYDNNGQGVWKDFKIGGPDVRVAPRWELLNNQTVLGGSGTQAELYAGVIALAADPKLLAEPLPPSVQMLVENNQLIRGSADEARETLKSIGLHSDGVLATIRSNRLVSGASSTSVHPQIEYFQPAALRIIGKKQRTISVTVRDNDIIANDSLSRGADFSKVSARCEENRIEGGNVGLSSHSDFQSTFTKNIVKAPGACLIGCSGLNDSNCEISGKLIFEGNECTSASKDGWALLVTDRVGGSRFSENRFRAERPIYFESRSPGPIIFDFQFNSNRIGISSTDKCAYWDFGSFTCKYRNPSDFGTSNTFW